MCFLPVQHASVDSSAGCEDVSRVCGCSVCLCVVYKFGR